MLLSGGGSGGGGSGGGCGLLLLLLLLLRVLLLLLGERRRVRRFRLAHRRHIELHFGCREKNVFGLLSAPDARRREVDEMRVLQEANDVLLRERRKFVETRRGERRLCHARRC